MTHIKQSSTARALVFFMADSADHVTGKTGLSPTVVLSKNGGTFASPSGSVTEIANGFYKVAGNATDTNTLGILTLSATGAGADQCAMAYEVVAYDPDSAVNLGLSNLDDQITDAVAAPAAALASYDPPTKAELDSGLAAADDAVLAAIDALNDLSAAQVNAEVDTALADYDAPTKAELDAGLAGLNDLSAAQVNAEVDTALADYDGPTNAEMEARTIASASYATSSALATVDSEIGTIDTVVDAIKAKTDNLPASPAATGDIPTLAQFVTVDTGETTPVDGSVTKLAQGAAGGDVTLAASQPNYAPSKAGDAMTLTSAYDPAKTAATQASVDDIPTTSELATALAAADDAVLAAINALNDYDGSDSPGVTTLLSRLTAIRAGLIDNLDVAVSTRNSTTPPTAAAIRTEVDSNSTQLAAIKAKTDNLPSDPADQSLLMDAIEGIEAGSAPSASEIADAVMDEALSGHTTPGTAGAALAAASASGDPWATTVPGDYEDGTAGAAIGRLNNTPAEAPVIVIPDPAEDVSVCTVYLYAETIANVEKSGIVVTFELSGSAKSERALEITPVVSMTTDDDGFASITLQRTDLITPAGRSYRVNCAALGLVNEPLTLTTSTKNLADMIV